MAAPTGINIHNGQALSVDVNLSGATFYPTHADAVAATNAITFPVTISADEDYYIAPPTGTKTITVSIKHNGREIAGVDGTGETIVLDRGIVAQLGVNYDSAMSVAAGGRGGNYKHTTSLVAAAGATETLVDLDTASIQHLILDASCTITFPTGAEGDELKLFLKQGGTGSYTVTWPSIRWPGAAAPTLTTTVGRTDALRFIYINGAWHGMVDGLALG